VYHDIQKEKRSQRRLEIDMEELSDEKQRILQRFSANPGQIDIEASKRLKQIDAELLANESAWFDAQDRMDHFEQELKIARD
jgi:hypothetical protein